MLRVSARSRMSQPHEDYGEDGEGEEDYIDLDLEKTLTWTGNAVIVQAGGEFRLPLIVTHPSVLAIQFEVDGGYDIEFSLLFKDDHENDYQVVRRVGRKWRPRLSCGGRASPGAWRTRPTADCAVHSLRSQLVQPVRVSDREGQLDIDTTGVCELLWSNAHAWVSSKVRPWPSPSLPKPRMPPLSRSDHVPAPSSPHKAAAASATPTPTPPAPPLHRALHLSPLAEY